jgi:hypothetical protein
MRWVTCVSRPAAFEAKMGSGYIFITFKATKP